MPARQIIYGWHSALAALQNPERVIHAVHATENAASRLAKTGLALSKLEIGDSRVIDRIAGAGAVHQGLAIICSPLPDRGLADLAGAGLIVVLDQITDPHNVGAIARSAAAFGAGGLVLTARHGPEDSSVLAKAASGGLEHVPVIRVANLARALDQIADLGFLRVGLDSEYDETIESIADATSLALVFGAEGKGLRRLTKEKCDRLVRLNMPGPIASLNVSNAAAIALYAVTRRR
ncbi:MAG TPA: 23S rRNA (guanosine(2251)-2'-O)-methyltransferase RlmB [Afifellaceae bacterium]|nr:23S rRNA (guanosine(2251)-2'-O)-methyltransferase RlmB [Afifellaceae bacterium]